MLFVATVASPWCSILASAGRSLTLFIKYSNNKYSTLLLTCTSGTELLPPILIRRTAYYVLVIFMLWFAMNFSLYSLTSGKYQGIPSDYTRQCSCAIRGGAVCVYANVILLLCAGWVDIVTMSVYR